MVKTLMTYSMLTAVVLMTAGCGSGNNDDGNTTVEDTAAPVFQNTTTRFNVTEETNSSVMLQATDLSMPITFSIAQTPNFTLHNKTLTFSAPAYEQNATNEYKVTVTATDASENKNSSQKVFTFIVEPKRAQTVVVAVGDKNLTVNGNKIIGPAGLEWINEDTDLMTYDEAVAHCAAKGYRVARRDEILNLMDYSQGNGANGKLLEEEFDQNTKSETWAMKVNGVQFYVNFFAGADGIEPDTDNTNDLKSVLCVKGESALPHTFKADGNGTTIDEATGLKWTNIVVNNALRRAINPDPGAFVQESAAESCPAGYHLPTIAQLRSIVNYSTNEVNETIVPDGVTLIWSQTQDPNNPLAIGKNYLLDATSTIISTEEENLTNFVTCVKSVK